jgi:hypothetical protein
MNKAVLERNRGIDPLFDPQPQTVKTPCCRPTYQRAEDEAIKDTTKATEASVIVVTCNESNRISNLLIFPVA